MHVCACRETAWEPCYEITWQTACAWYSSIQGSLKKRNNSFSIHGQFEKWYKAPNVRNVHIDPCMRHIYPHQPWLPHILCSSFAPQAAIHIVRCPGGAIVSEWNRKCGTESSGGGKHTARASADRFGGLQKYAVCYDSVFEVNSGMFK